MASKNKKKNKSTIEQLPLDQNIVALFKDSQQDIASYIIDDILENVEM